MSAWNVLVSAAAAATATVVAVVVVASRVLARGTGEMTRLLTSHSVGHNFINKCDSASHFGAFALFFASATAKSSVKTNNKVIFFSPQKSDETQKVYKNKKLTSQSKAVSHNSFSV